MWWQSQRQSQRQSAAEGLFSSCTRGKPPAAIHPHSTCTACRATLLPAGPAASPPQLMAEYTANVVARAGAMLDQQLQVGVPMLQHNCYVVLYNNAAAALLQHNCYNNAATARNFCYWLSTPLNRTMEHSKQWRHGTWLWLVAIPGTTPR